MVLPVFFHYVMETDVYPVDAIRKKWKWQQNHQKETTVRNVRSMIGTLRKSKKIIFVSSYVDEYLRIPFFVVESRWFNMFVIFLIERNQRSRSSSSTGSSDISVEDNESAKIRSESPKIEERATERAGKDSCHAISKIAKVNLGRRVDQPAQTRNNGRKGIKNVSTTFVFFFDVIVLFLTFHA